VNLLNSLTWRSLKLNRKRTIVTVIGDHPFNGDDLRHYHHRGQLSRPLYQASKADRRKFSRHL